MGAELNRYWAVRSSLCWAELYLFYRVIYCFLSKEAYLWDPNKHEYITWSFKILSLKMLAKLVEIYKYNWTSDTPLLMRSQIVRSYKFIQFCLLQRFVIILIKSRTNYIRFSAFVHSLPEISVCSNNSVFRF